MATYAEHIAARNDAELTARLVAAAERACIDNAEPWVMVNRGRIVATQLPGDTSLADVHAYAVASYQPVPLPGADPTKVTDDLIKQAIEAVKNPPVARRRPG